MYDHVALLRFPAHEPSERSAHITDIPPPAFVTEPHTAEVKEDPAYKLANSLKERPNDGLVTGRFQTRPRASPIRWPTFVDISAGQNDIGYAPTTTIDVGIPRFIDRYKDPSPPPSATKGSSSAGLPGGP